MSANEIVQIAISDDATVKSYAVPGPLERGRLMFSDHGCGYNSQAEVTAAGAAF